jgi:hypothetical protein
MKPLRSLRFNLVAAIVAVCLSVALAACAESPRVAIAQPDGTRRAIIKVEIADTPSARELGLMYRKQLDEDAGMIFVFPAPDRLSFWMKNTEIPLDMIFADSNGVVLGIVANAVPFSEHPVGVQDDSRYVLEVNGGYAQRHHVHPSDKLEFLGFTPRATE